ncbi:hypothetical protein [Achromobacter anxifer]
MKAISTANNEATRVTQAYSGAKVSPRKSPAAAVDSPAVAPSPPATPGRTLLRERLFRDPNFEAPFRTDPGFSMEVTHYLWEEDRVMLSDLYVEAQQQGIDLRNVDMLGFELGYYRRTSKMNFLNANEGGTFDSEGHQLSYFFSDTNAAIAERILASDGLSSSRLDRGFLERTLNPGISLAHDVDFGFLEEVFNKFGPSAPKSGQPFDSKFSEFIHTRDEGIVKASAEVVLDLSSDKTETECINGVFRITEYGYQLGLRLVNGLPVQGPAGLAGNADAGQAVLPSASMPEQPALMERLRDLMSARKNTDAVGAVLRTIWDGNAPRDLQS